MFENASDYHDRYGRTAAPGRRFAPRLEDGDRLEAMRRRLAGSMPLATTRGTLAGHVERLEQDVLEGWVMDPLDPATPVQLEVLVAGRVVATVPANRYRPDLDRAGLAGGRCGFAVALPASADGIARVAVRRAADGAPVPMP
jgi:hypothetical protein